MSKLSEAKKVVTEYTELERSKNKLIAYVEGRITEVGIIKVIELLSMSDTLRKLANAEIATISGQMMALNGEEKSNEQ